MLVLLENKSVFAFFMEEKMLDQIKNVSGYKETVFGLDDCKHSNQWTWNPKMLGTIFWELLKMFV